MSPIRFRVSGIVDHNPTWGLLAQMAALRPRCNRRWKPGSLPGSGFQIESERQCGFQFCHHGFWKPAEFTFQPHSRYRDKSLKIGDCVPVKERESG